VEFYGQIIAAVIATTENIAKRAAELVDVTYQPLPCITTIQVFNFIVMPDKLKL